MVRCCVPHTHLTRGRRSLQIPTKLRTPLEVIRAWYTPTGHLVYLREDGALFATPFDLDALEIVGSSIPLFDGVNTAVDRVDMQLAADGTLLYMEGFSTGTLGEAPSLPT